MILKVNCPQCGALVDQLLIVEGICCDCHDRYFDGLKAHYEEQNKSKRPDK